MGKILHGPDAKRQAICVVFKVKSHYYPSIRASRDSHQRMLDTGRHGLCRRNVINPDPSTHIPKATSVRSTEHLGHSFPPM